MRFGVVFLLLAAVALPATKQRHPWREVVRTTGPRYEVETNTFPEIARDLEVTLNRAYVFFEDRFGPLRGKARRPMKVRLFRTRKEYLVEGEGVAGALGHFDPSNDTCSIVWSGETGDTGWPVAVHEAAHQYLYRRHGRLRLPSWYSEGIACWFEGLQDRTTAGHVSRLRYVAARAALRDGQAKLDVVLDPAALVQRGRLSVSGLTPSRYYGLAWSLVHFLATHEDYARRFRRFEMRLLAARPGQTDAVVDARRLLEEECGPLDVLERRWRTHISLLETPPPLVKAAPYAWELTSDNAFDRYAALRRIHKHPFPASLEPGVFACLRDDDVIVRTEAARLMQRDPRAPGVYALLKSLDWGDEELKAATLRALGHRSMRAAVPRLLEETESREEALRALAGMGDARAFPALRDAALDPDLSLPTRRRAIRVLARDPSARPTLRRVAEKAKSADLRQAARDALVRGHGDLAPDRGVTRGSRPAKALLRDAIDPSRSEYQRRKAMGELAKLRHRPAVPALQRLCRPGVEPAIRLEAIRTLVAITGETRGYEPGQPASERAAAFRAWMPGGSN
ncbi:MAG: DUF1570 domain-containing protein [Planctomycetota bacterium]